MFPLLEFHSHNFDIRWVGVLATEVAIIVILK